MRNSVFYAQMSAQGPQDLGIRYRVIGWHSEEMLHKNLFDAFPVGSRIPSDATDPSLMLLKIVLNNNGQIWLQAELTGS